MVEILAYIVAAFVVGFIVGDIHRRRQFAADEKHLLKVAAEAMQLAKNASKTYKEASAVNDHAAKMYQETTNLYMEIQGKVPWDSIKKTLPESMDKND